MNPISEDALHQQARRRAGMKLGWYIHAAVYAAVNLGLMALALSQGRHWAVYPALRGGGGGLSDGGGVWRLAPGSPLFQQLLEHELKTLKRSEKR